MIEQSFWQAIMEDPADDVSRLVYADWLEERGDPRGEFIRVQCALDKQPWVHGITDILQGRERELLAKHRQEWGEPWSKLLGTGFSFHRGFVAAVTVEDISLIPELLQQSPIEGLTIFGKICHHQLLTDLANLPRWRFIRELDLTVAHVEEI
jgi:uncharacterized protein (TIGR02996 family)